MEAAFLAKYEVGSLESIGGFACHVSEESESK